MTDAAVTIEGVTKRFPGGARPAVNNITAMVATGRLTGLVGPDGAGKTTLIRLITGLMASDAGRIAVFGRDTAAHPERVHAMTGYMPQRFGLYEDLSVLQNLNLYADLRGVAGKERMDAYNRLLAFTGLGPFTARLAGRLSGGMKQKLGLACALISRPRLLLLDEPSVGVDPLSRRELWSMVSGLVAEGIAVVWSTAYLDEAEKCDTVLLLNEGELLFHGPPADLTGRIAGRSFHLTGVAGQRRAVLAEALDADGVIDGVIQGRHVRLVLDGKTPVTDIVARLSDEAGQKASARPVPPRFEDAFVDILGGGPGGRSPLAAQMPVIGGDGGAVIEATGLTKRFGDFTAVDNVSFRIERGEVFGFLGPNGAGKSTTFKMLCGLLKPTRGEARVTGIDLKTAASTARARIGYMAQKFSLYGNLSVRQNLDFFSGAYNLTGARRRERIRRMIETFAFEPYLDATAGDLPLGYKQRLALACAVMHDPHVLFLDEPTSGVDPITRREFWTHINGMVEKGVTIMVSTHFMDEAEYCDRIALIYSGHEVATGSPDELKDSVRSADMPNPTLEDAFVELVRAAGRAEGRAA